MSEGDLRCSLSLSPKVLADSFAVQFVTLVPVDYSTFLWDIVPVPGGNQEILDGFASLDMDHKCS